MLPCAAATQRLAGTRQEMRDCLLELQDAEFSLGVFQFAVSGSVEVN